MAYIELRLLKPPIFCSTNYVRLAYGIQRIYIVLTAEAETGKRYAYIIDCKWKNREFQIARMDMIDMQYSSAIVCRYWKAYITTS